MHQSIAQLKRSLPILILGIGWWAPFSFATVNTLVLATSVRELRGLDAALHVFVAVVLPLLVFMRSDGRARLVALIACNIFLGAFFIVLVGRDGDIGLLDAAMLSYVLIGIILSFVFQRKLSMSTPTASAAKP